MLRTQLIEKFVEANEIELIDRIDAVGFLIPRRFTQVWFKRDNETWLALLIGKNNDMVHSAIRLTDLDIQLAKSRPAQFKERIVEPVVACIDGALKAA